MAFHTQLRTYALMDPADIPDSIKLCHSATSVTIHDKWPKGKFHALVLPRVLPPLRIADLANLRALLMLPREQARAVLVGLRRDARAAVKLIEEEMELTHSCSWPIQMGFHALPSVEYVAPPLKHLQHLHLHLISTDFMGSEMKRKKHMNSFHPRMGFFIHIDEVIRWFGPDIEPTWFARKAAIDQKEYEAILKQEMLCPLCDEPYKTMPKLKKHLEAHWRKTKEEGIDRMMQRLLAEQDADEMAEAAARAGESAGAEAEAVADSHAAPEGSDAVAENNTTAEHGLKRKHGEGDETDPIDVDALPESLPAKRQQMTAPGA